MMRIRMIYKSMIATSPSHKNTEMKYGQRNGMRKGDIIKAKIIGQNEKGFILSTKNLEE